ncbi:unnamed protein product [Schistosoma curassoni]|uniref:Mrr_N domain-containing protein n=1 Tax=Schistosoma curassoni TaxID=6186 RepID=A0A183K569_9TREM|nr:unnamed protein product [Schistosoma curassoni]
MVEKAAREGNMKQLDDTTKKLAGEYCKPERPVKDKEGRPITEIQQQRNRWVEYFEELLNKPAPIDVNPPTTEEIRMAIAHIKSGKAARPNNIPAEALKSDIEVTTNMLHLLYRKIREEGYLIKVPKKGDLSKCENYRGITLLSVPGKVFDTV